MCYLEAYFFNSCKKTTDMLMREINKLKRTVLERYKSYEYRNKGNCQYFTSLSGAQKATFVTRKDRLPVGGNVIERVRRDMCLDSENSYSTIYKLEGTALILLLTQ